MEDLLCSIVACTSSMMMYVEQKMGDASYQTSNQNRLKENEETGFDYMQYVRVVTESPTEERCYAAKLFESCSVDGSLCSLQVRLSNQVTVNPAPHPRTKTALRIGSNFHFESLSTGKTSFLQARLLAVVARRRLRSALDAVRQ